jgi:hypothetical protein
VAAPFSNIFEQRYGESKSETPGSLNMKMREVLESRWLTRLSFYYTYAVSVFLWSILSLKDQKVNLNRILMMVLATALGFSSVRATRKKG